MEKSKEISPLRKKIIEVAAKENGYAELIDDKGGNLTKYGKWFGLNRVPWCGIFVSWVYWFAGKPLGNIGYLKGFAGCDTGFKHFKEKGMITNDPKPGDIVLYDWDGNGNFEHTGIFLGWIKEHSTFNAWEGNTSLKNQSNGGQVMLRDRTLGKHVFANVIGD